MLKPGSGRRGGSLGSARRTARPSMAGSPDFDIMLECKQKDLALLRLREDLGRYTPDVAARFREVVAGGEET